MEAEAMGERRDERALSGRAVEHGVARPELVRKAGHRGAVDGCGRHEPAAAIDGEPRAELGDQRSIHANEA
jgi:hypothetical protein